MASVQFNLTASTLRAMLCYVRSGKTPAIAYDRDDLAEPLANKLQEAVGEKAGSESVSIDFDDGEEELLRQFQACAANIGSIFLGLSRMFRN